MPKACPYKSVKALLWNDDIFMHIFVVSLLPLLLPLQQTVAILVVLSIVMNFQLAWKLRAHVEWKTMLPTLLSGILFQSLCVPLLFLVDAGILRRILGAVLIGFALFFAFVKERIRLKKSPANAVIAGGLTGLFNRSEEHTSELQSR